MSDESQTEKSIKELIDEHGEPARARWREVFEEMRAEDDDIEEAAKFADSVIRLEVSRGVLVTTREHALNRRSRLFVELVANRTSPDGKSIDPAWIENIVTGARGLASEFKS